MTFRDQITSDLNNVVLNTSDFAETVTYWPQGGTERSIAVVPFNAVRPLYEDDGRNQELVERFPVVCSRSATTGIDEPQPGEEITRAAADEPDERPYQFSGEIIWKTRDAHCLVFERARDITHGVPL